MDFVKQKIVQKNLNKEESNNMNEQHPLQDKANWKEKKSWIFPLEITAMVDNANEYDDAMVNFSKRILGEFTALCRHYTKNGLSVSFLEPVKDPAKFKELVKSMQVKEKMAEMEDEVAKAVALQIKKMKEAGSL